MKVAQLMNRAVATCSPDDAVARAAEIMMERDCGVVPVVDAEGRALGMITDRDICMAALREEKLLSRIPVMEACSRMVFSVHPDDPLEAAEQIMKRRRVRRLPVIEESGRLVGILSLSDIARHAGERRDEIPGDEVTQTLSSIVGPNVVR